MAEIAFEPSLDRVDELLEEFAVSKMLLFGSPDIAVPASVETRCVPPIPFVRGLFAFRKNDVGVLVYVEEGRSEPPQRLPETRLEDDHFLMQARGLYDNYWDRADFFGRRATFRKGDYVELEGSDSVGVVHEVIQTDGYVRYQVRIGQSVQVVTESGLSAASIDDSDPSSWLRVGAESADRFALTLTHTKLSNPLTDTIYAFMSSKTVYRAYQFRPLLRIIDTDQPRLLIADEVGLGKTIEAGLIWTELEQRAGAQKVLVVCPASLVFKWQDEMRRRFDRRVERLDASKVRELADRFIRGEVPNDFAGVISLQALRSADLVAILAESHPDFDLVIVDEAHHMRNRSTLSYELGRLLSDWSDALIFLSATPVNLGSSDLFNLLNLLDEDEFSDPAIFEQQLEPNRYINEAARLLSESRHDPGAVRSKLDGISSTLMGSAVCNRPEYEELLKLLSVDRPLRVEEVAAVRSLLSELNTLSRILTRTRKKDTPDRTAIREPMQIDVAWSDEEHGFYVAVLNWARRRALLANGVVGFATVMPLRQVASCIPAAISMLFENHPDLSEDLAEFEDDLPLLEEVQLSSEEEPLPVEQAEDGPEWISLQEAARRLPEQDSKFEEFVSWLRRLEGLGIRQAMVFSFFRRTLSYLERRLTELGFNVAVMHGGVKMSQREEIMRSFREGKVDLLLLSEVGSEGLDFEFCNALFNYDLPWNPMRVEQRIGRLDRFGQEHDKIFIFNFHVPGTIETDIFERLYKRIHVFEESIGELEPILRSTLAGLQRSILDPSLSDEQREAELERSAVALEVRDRQLEDIRQAQSYLAGIDELLVEGLNDLRSRGGFVGPTEVEALVRALISDGTRSRIRATGVPHRLILRGDEVLADRLVRHVRTGRGSRYGIASLARMLRERDEILLTLDNEDASKNGLELLSLRHPLVRTAVAHLAEDGGDLPRFGTLKVSGFRVGSFAVMFYVVRVTGLRPSLELKPLAVDLQLNRVDPDAGVIVLHALAEGRLSDGPPVGDLSELSEAIETAQREMYAFQEELEAERRRSNEAMVQSRYLALEASYEGKIARDTATLRGLEREGRAESILRLYRGKISNLEQRLLQKKAEIDQKRNVAVTFTPVGIARVETTS